MLLSPIDIQTQESNILWEEGTKDSSEPGKSGNSPHTRVDCLFPLWPGSVGQVKNSKWLGEADAFSGIGQLSTGLKTSAVRILAKSISYSTHITIEKYLWIRISKQDNTSNIFSKE